MKKNYLATLFGLLSTAFMFGQITLKTDNFTKTLTNLNAIPVCDTSNIGISIPLDDKLKKYDKFVVLLKMRKQGTNESFRAINGVYFESYAYYPTSETFKDRYEGQKKIDICVKRSSSTKQRGLFLRTNFCGNLKSAESTISYEYKVAIQGYFESGTESYWSDFSKSVKTRTLYKYSKDIYTSVPFSFVLGTNDKAQLEAGAAKAAKAKKREETYQEIKEKYSLTLDVPVVGLTQPRIHIFTAYELLRDKLIDQKDFKTLNKVDAKMLSIGKKFNTLNKSLKGEADTNKIMKEILNFPY